MTTDTSQAAIDAVIDRADSQRGRLHGPPIPARFSYDRNGLRLGISALEDEVQELLDAWREHKKYLHQDSVREAIRHEVLDIAAVALLILEEIPDA